jgi:RND superfamily putative drug exporter
MLSRIGRWCFTHARATAALWFVAVVAVTAVSNIVGPAFSDEMAIPESDSASGFDLLDEHFGVAAGSFIGGQIVFVADQGIDDPAVRAAMEEYFAEVAEIPEVVEIRSPYAPEGLFQISTSGALEGKLAFADVTLDPDTDQVRAAEVGSELLETAPDLDGLRVEIGGQNLAEFEPPESEMIGLAFAIVVLIVAFGSVLAMGLPIGVALAGVGSAAGLVALLSHATTVPEFATTIGAMIGLGVGIDYALFIVTRYREGLHHGLDPLDATVAAMDTAGRAVIFAGLTVVISLLGMLVIGLAFVSGLGIAASITVLVTMIASTTLLPALLGFARERVEVTRWRGLIAAALVAVALLGVGLGIDALTVGLPLAVVVLVASFAVAPLRREVPRRAPKPVRETTAYRWSRVVQRHPWAAALGGTAALLLLATPAFDLHLGFSDEGNFSPDTTTRQAYDLLAEGFGAGFNGPFMVVAEVDGPDDLAALGELSTALTETEGVALATPPIPNTFEGEPTAALIRVIPTTSPQDEATEHLVTELREVVIPEAMVGTDLQPFVTGFVPVAIDFSSYLAERMVVFFGIVLLLSFLLLMAVFRSLLVPLKAVVMNVLSLAAAYGVCVAVFQWGWGGSVLGVSGAPIEPFLPMMMFAIVFGLSMDYEVFLLSRIKEEYDLTGDAKESVADGLAATARVITAAAAIMVVVFGSFLLDDARVVKLFGLGLAVAVLLDATLVRMLLVPATMELLGERNWWLPRWLDRILPRIDVEGPQLEQWDISDELDLAPSSAPDGVAPADPDEEPALTR